MILSLPATELRRVAYRDSGVVNFVANEGLTVVHHSAVRPSLTTIVLLLGIMSAAGCSRYTPPSFSLNTEGIDRAEKYADGTQKYSPEKMQAVVNAVVAAFGEPDDPFVFEETELDRAKIQMSAGPVSSDIEGTPHGLYRKHCSQCHGISGDGAGPSAMLLNPYPRDFRKGIFKFTSTAQGAKPTDDDLRKSILAGIPGTGMPSFGTLSPEEIDSLVEYVKYLGYRGEVETLIQSLIVDEDEELDYEFLLDEAVVPIADLWIDSQDESMIVVPEDPRPSDREASVAAGRKMFAGERGCAKCHGPTGAGDGKEKNYDMWNNLKVTRTPEDIKKLWALPLQELRPRNLRAGVYRGGRDAIDIYRRIYVGIKGTPMPASGPPPGQSAATGALPEGSKAMNSTQIWNLVDYVLSLPYEDDLKKDDAVASNNGLGGWRITARRVARLGRTESCEY